MRNEDGDLVATGIVVGSALAFLAVIVPILKDPESRRLPKGDYEELMRRQGDLDTFVASILVFGVTALSLDATARVVHHFRATGEIMSMEEIEQQYQGVGWAC